MKTEPNEVVTQALQYGVWGLTKREYFAAAALQGFAGNSDTFSAAKKLAGDGNISAQLAMASVEMADYLIDALNMEKTRERN